MNLPRPTNEQHLSSRRAMMRVVEDISKAGSYIICGLISAYLIKAASNALGYSLLSGPGRFFFIFAVLALIVPTIDIVTIKNKYFRIFQRETYGAARWADLTHLKSKSLVTPNDKSPLPEAIPIGTFGLRHWLTLPIKMMAKHVMVLGPHGSGKTASFFINVIRAWSHVGSALVLDISKNHGEVSRLSAHYYKNALRFDLVNPECSDRFSLRVCKRDPAMAWEVACLMLNYDPNNKGGGMKEPVWIQAACALLKCLLLEINERVENPTISDIFQFVADHPHDKENKVDLLEQALTGSAYVEVRQSYARFLRGAGGADRVSASVFFSMFSPLEAFDDPNVRKVMSMPTPGEVARGCRVIDFDELRKPGTVIYCVVKEGQASRLESVIGTFFGMAISQLRKNADVPGACHVLVSWDEAAQVPTRNFLETLTTARGRKMAFMCGYQNITQLEAQFGSSYAKAVRQAFLTKIFLPGLTDESAEFATKLLHRTTTFQSSSNDAVGRAFDSERLTEVGVDLMNPNEFREMLEFTQAITVVDTANPARIGFPPMAEAVDPTETFPARFDMSYPVTKDAIELYRQAMMTPLERIINGVRPALLGEEREL
ncbi:MAG TPA: type IV secretory system conjugative DNA transfer family protein, partial [Pyrinomonadaceae bacterium]